MTNPQRRLRHGQRPNEQLDWSDTASQSQAVPSELASLKELASKATPGPWQATGRYIGNMNHRSCVGEVRDENGNWSDTARSTGNAAYIAAANPATILKLIEQVESLSHSAATGEAAPAVLDLPSAIMDIPCEPVAAWGAIGVNYYRLGHRDARHAAADLVLKRADELAALASPAAPLAGKAEPDRIEEAAKAIYKLLPACQGRDATTNPWQEGGNSIKQDEARSYARAAFSAFAPLAAAVHAEEASAAPFPERNPNVPAEQQGLFRKFDVHRVDGSDQPGGKHHGCRYYVLDLTHDQHAPAAMRAYAASCRATHPQLAADIEAEFGTPAEPAPILASADLPEVEILGALEAITHEVPKRLPPGWLKFAREIEKRVLARLSKPTAQGTAEPVAELYDILQQVEKELEGCSFSQTLVREGNKQVWRYIGNGRIVADRVKAAVKDYRHIAAQAPAGRDAHPFPLIIDIGYRKTLRREDRVHGPHGWLLYDEDGKLVRGLNCYEQNFVDAAIKAMGGKSHAAEQASGGAKC